MFEVPDVAGAEDERAELTTIRCEIATLGSVVSSLTALNESHGHWIKAELTSITERLDKLEAAKH